MLYSKMTISLHSAIKTNPGESKQFSLVIGFISLKLSIFFILFFKIAESFKLLQINSILTIL